REHELGQLLAIKFGGQAIACLIKPATDEASPVVEVAVDERTRLGKIVSHFQRQLADRTTHAAGKVLHAFTIPLQQSKDALNGIFDAFDMCHHARMKLFQREFQDAAKQSFFAGEEVIKAAAVDFRFAEDCGNAGGVITLLVEEPEGGIENSSLCFCCLRHSLLIERSIKINDGSPIVSIEFWKRSVICQRG